MHTFLLKNNWERFKAHTELDSAILAKLLAPYTKDTIKSFVLLSNGCANSNYKIVFNTNRPPVVLRIYMREASALAREIAIYSLIEKELPVPRVYYFNNQIARFPYCYAILEWKEGELMRDVLLSNEESAIAACAFAAGKLLNIFREIKFPVGGFFEENLAVRPFQQDELYLPFMLSLLQSQQIKTSLSDELLTAIEVLIKKYADLLPQQDSANLTHGDYDPSNILVSQMNGTWHITAILDWEFAYAGTYLLDIGLMLRYSHKLPHCFERMFIKGIEENGESLPKSWKKQAKLMDLLCLLQLLHDNPLHQRPNLHTDVAGLIQYIVTNWHLF